MQMCAIGRALMSKPSTILLDEPSMGLAPQLVEEIFEIVRDLNEKEGVSFLLAEQNTNVALKYATYGYILESGRIVLDGDAKALRENEDVKEFYLGVGGEGRRLVIGQNLMHQPVGAVGGVDRAAFGPGLVVAPVGQERAIECGLVARLGVFGAEEMAAGTDLLHRRDADEPPRARPVRLVRSRDRRCRRCKALLRSALRLGISVQPGG